APDFLFLINADISQQCDDQSGRDDAPCADSEKLMEVLDQLNAKDGKGRLYFAGPGIQQQWEMKREKLSPDIPPAMKTCFRLSARFN
ncbi:DUF4113 domain-containing protein, partial [Salmonella enterica subsp. arizonae serovar 47:z4,z23:-]|nr:DUF4113 domain-containing protein [Salmonella enterica subsp. arizonae serovar 47:z4,z23:-]